MKAKSNILIISDMTQLRKVAAAVQMPILSYMGLDVFNLPTMLISNTFPYGKYAIRNALRISKPCRSGTGWAFILMPSPRFHGFGHPGEAGGIIAEQARWANIYVDPVMGDYGKLYGGASESTVRCMKEMLSVSHLCFPNYTEACLLTDSEYKEEGISEGSYELIDKLRAKFRSVLITSCIVEVSMPW